MTDNGAHELGPFAGMRTSFRQQAWLLGVSRRWVPLTLILLVVLLLLLMLGDFPPKSPPIIFAAVLALPVSVIWAATVWSGETPTRRTYHWSLPVARPGHDLARIFVGALYLLGAYAVLAGAGALVSVIDGTFPRFAAIQPVAWANYILAPLIIYLLVMPNVLWSEYRITHVVYGAFFGVIIVANILKWVGFGFGADSIHKLIFASEGLGSAMVAGMLPEITSLVAGDAVVAGEPWLPAALLWLGIGLVLTLFTAMFRPDDLRRFKK
jgi:hypothetical protein